MDIAGERMIVYFGGCDGATAKALGEAERRFFLQGCHRMSVERGAKSQRKR